MNRIKLFCLPYAGGIAASIYAKWKPYLEHFIELVPLDLSGRGRRLDDKLLDNFDEIVDDLFKIITGKMKHHKFYAFFGHSLGSLICYELYFKMIHSGYPEPVHIFLSGCSAPNKKKLDKEFHTLSDEEFIQEVIDLGGTAQDVFSDEHLKKIFLPILRADFELAEFYQYDKKKEKMNSPVTLFHGKNDKEFTIEEIIAWQEFVNTKLNLHFLEGDHFFIHDQTKIIVKIINHLLLHKNYNELPDK